MNKLQISELMRKKQTSGTLPTLTGKIGASAVHIGLVTPVITP